MSQPHTGRRFRDSLRPGADGSTVPLKDVGCVDAGCESLRLAPLEKVGGDGGAGGWWCPGEPDIVRARSAMATGNGLDQTEPALSGTGAHVSANSRLIWQHL